MLLDAFFGLANTASASTSTEYVLYIDMQFLTILLVDSAVDCNLPSMSMYALSSSVSVSATVNDSMSLEYLYRILYIYRLHHRSQSGNVFLASDLQR